MNHFQQHASLLALTLSMFICLFMGCENGQQPMIEQIVNPIIEEDPTLDPIEFEPTIPERTIPGEWELLDSDKVYHVNELPSSGSIQVNDEGEINASTHTAFRAFDPLIFDDAISANMDKNVQDFFHYQEKVVEAACTVGEVALPDDYHGLIVYFPYPNREERDKFAEQFDKKLWEVESSVVVNNDTAYFQANLHLRNAFSLCQ